MDREKLKKWRAELGLTQVELADLIGASRRSIIDWESGVTTIPAVVADQMKRHGHHGPVTLFWHTSPIVRGPGHRATQLQHEPFDTVDEALDRACKVLSEDAAFTAHVLDNESHEFLWDLPSLRREMHRRKRASAERTAHSKA